MYYCTVCTVPLVQWFSVASTGRLPIGPCFYSYCGCTIAQCVLCLCFMYSGLAWLARVMYIQPVLCSYCAYTIAQCVLHVYPFVQWFSIASTGHVPIGPCFYSYCGCTIAQCVLSGMASTGNVYFACFCTRNCACIIPQCVLSVYPLYSGLAWPARAVYLLARVLIRTVVVSLHSLVAHVQCLKKFWHGQPGGCIDLSRICTRSVHVSLHSVYCACTLCTHVCV